MVMGPTPYWQVALIYRVDSEAMSPCQRLFRDGLEVVADGRWPTSEDVVWTKTAAFDHSLAVPRLSFGYESTAPGYTDDD